MVKVPPSGGVAAGCVCRCQSGLSIEHRQPPICGNEERIERATAERSPVFLGEPGRRHVEWLGTFWGHAVASSTPPADLVLHLRAWQHHFAALFGEEALGRVQGFSPPEMDLPNDPDQAYALVRALRECGYRWVLVQADSVEHTDGSSVRRPYLPHKLVAGNLAGESASITALLKTRGTDNTLIASMQPIAEAHTLRRVELGSTTITPLVTQIGDGENGPETIHEFPSAYLNSLMNLAGESVAALNGTEYLELIEAAGGATFWLMTSPPSDRSYACIEAGTGRSRRGSRRRRLRPRRSWPGGSRR